TPATFGYGDTNLSVPINSTWWKSLNDEQLTKNIEQALTNNFDLISADASVDAMLGKFDTAKSYLYPQINANGSLTRQGVNGTDSYQLRDGVTSTYAANLSLASYEIDLFGRVRRANEAVRAQLLASEFSRQTLRIAISSNVAASYIKLSSLESQSTLARENIKASEEINTLNALKYQHGVIPQTTLLQSQSELQSAKATLAQLEAAKIAEESTFNLLLGRNPSRVSTTALEQITRPNLPSALPSQILQHRPDIALAEQNLIAANAKIGIARAAYYPSIQLTGMAGVQSLALQDFTANPTTIWKILPTITLPIFTAGRIEGEVKTAEAEHNQSLSSYKKAIISAFNDADNAIGQNTKADEQLRYQKERSDAIQTAFEQSKLRYKVGTIAYNDLLLVQQQWISAQQSYLQARQNALISTVNLYKAFGGGWDNNQNIPIPNMLPAGR
ncbi:MAG: efflux transporter outer membrane subunit, partial [Sulfuricurvum sp.]|nr:efflux transporter outer membrane subunit [Sulfuricurvum sp.]